MRRLTLIGGGVWAPQLVEGLAQAIAQPLQITLSARRPGPLAAIAAEAQRRLHDRGLPGRVGCTTDRERALEGAEIVVLLARIGGYAARAWDEGFPRRFGLVGDEGLGPGGLANAWRTLPWMRSLGAALQRRCPEAWVVNLMAPLGVTTQALLAAGVRAVGVCELPAVTRRALGGLSPSSSHGGGRYGGLNHLGWFWDLPHRPGIHPLKYVERVFGELSGQIRPPLPPPGRAAALDELSGSLLRAFEGAGASPRDTRLETQRLEAQRLEAQRPTPWFDEATVPAIRALLGEAPWAGYANVSNDGLIPELPGGHVVELQANWAEGGPRPIAPGPLPAAITPFLQAVARAEATVTAASAQGDRAGLAQAMWALPLGLDEATAWALAEAAARDLCPSPSEAITP